jgi:hypothetical protein
MLTPSSKIGCGGWEATMGKIKIKYYVVKKSGRAYWRPTRRMRALGFHLVSLGMDGPEAWALAATWNERWQAVRSGKAPALIEQTNISREEAEAVRHYPPRSLGAAWQVYIRTPEWSARAFSSRTKVWWPAWHRIREMWGDVAPNTITFEMMSRWRAKLEAAHGRGVAHKTLRVWRSFWTIMLGMRVATVADPSKGIRNKAPDARWQTWEEGEAVRLVKAAWRAGYRGLACIVATAWDTGFAPVDVRTLAARHRATAPGGRLMFDRREDGRKKTGRPAVGTLSPRTAQLVAAYFEELGELHGARLVRDPAAFLFLNRSRAPYRDDTLADDFAAVRVLAFPGDQRQLRDMRRSGTVEAIAGGADALGLAAKLANSIDRSNTLHRTYAPSGQPTTVQAVDAARVVGRRLMRRANETGAKVSPQRPRVILGPQNRGR